MTASRARSADLEAPTYRSASVASLVRRAAVAPSRADQVAVQLSAVIAKLKPGERLGTKTELREQFGVAIATFNETLRILQSQGLLEVRRGPHGGLFAAERSPMAQLGHAVLHLDTNAASIAEAMDIRDALDPMLIEDALLHSSAHHVGLMRQQLDSMAAAISDSDGIAFLHANWKLHATIAEVSPRPMLKAFYITLLNLIEQHTISVASDAQRPLSGFHQDRYDVHLRLVDAIANRDEQEAREAIHLHKVGLKPPTS